MIPIHELLNRIRWDEAFAQGDFVIGYYDRAEQKIIRVPLQQIHFTPAIIFSSRSRMRMAMHMRFLCIGSRKSPRTVS